MIAYFPSATFLSALAWQKNSTQTQIIFTTTPVEKKKVYDLNPVSSTLCNDISTSTDWGQDDLRPKDIGNCPMHFLGACTQLLPSTNQYLWHWCHLSLPPIVIPSRLYGKSNCSYWKGYSLRWVFTSPHFVASWFIF